MVAAPGTVARELVDWLETDEQQRLFELGGQEFVGRSSEPTMESKLRPAAVHPDAQGPSGHWGPGDRSYRQDCRRGCGQAAFGGARRAGRAAAQGCADSR